MKISLYPTADGCLRPDEVLSRARICLQAGQRVAISSGDPTFDELSGAVLVRRVGRAFNAFHSIKPAVAIIDALDFTDPDGEELLSHQEMPTNPPVPVAGIQFVRMLELLRDRSGTVEVLLVSANDAISPAWREKLSCWDVEIHWNRAKTTPWRTWYLESGKGVLPPTRFPVARHQESVLRAEIHSPRSHLLLALAAEFSDIFCKDADSWTAGAMPVNENPGWLLIRMLAGKPVAEQIRLCQQLNEDFRFLAAIAGNYLRAGKGAGTRDTPKPAVAAKSLRPAPAHTVPGRKLH